MTSFVGTHMPSLDCKTSLRYLQPEKQITRSVKTIYDVFACYTIFICLRSIYWVGLDSDFVELKVVLDWEKAPFENESSKFAFR